MTQPPSAYELAESVHSTLFGDPTNQNRGFIREGEVRADIAIPYGTERLTAVGKVDGRSVYQHLSRSRKTGAFHLSTVFTEPGGKVLLRKITKNSPSEVIEIVEETLFMQAFQRVS